jgi:hypothetical protein
MLKPPFEVRWHQDEGFAQTCPDDEWLSVVGKAGWIVCSHDAKWQNESAPLKAIQQHRIGCFYLWGASSPSFFKLKSLAHNYDKIIVVCKSEKRPYIYRVTSGNRLKKVL